MLDFFFGMYYNVIHKKLPPDTRTWKYNMNALQEVRPLINRFIDIRMYKLMMKNLIKSFIIVKRKRAVL